MSTAEQLAAALAKLVCEPGHSGYRDNAREALAAYCQSTTAPEVPSGYKLVLVPDEPPGGEPDWDECIRQAEVATGIKVERNTLSIVIREVRRWLYQRHATQAPMPAPCGRDCHAVVDGCDYPECAQAPAQATRTTRRTTGCNGARRGVRP